MERHVEPLTEPWSTAGSADGRPGGASSLKSLTQRLPAGLFLARARVVGGTCQLYACWEGRQTAEFYDLGGLLGLYSLPFRSETKPLCTAPSRSPLFSTDLFIPSKEFFIAVALPKPNINQYLLVKSCSNAV